MEFREAADKRRMVRNYLDRDVDDDTVDRVVNLARRGPSAGFAQGQYLIVVRDGNKRRLIAEMADEALYVAQGFPPWMSTAPVHVVICTSEDDYHRRYQEPDKVEDDGSEIGWPVPYWYVDAGAVLMLLLLGAVDEGLGAGFFGAHRLPELRALLGIPDDVVPIGVVTLGYPADEQPAGSAQRGWKPLDEVVRRERW